MKKLTLVAAMAMLVAACSNSEPPQSAIEGEAKKKAEADLRDIKRLSRGMGAAINPVAASQGAAPEAQLSGVSKLTVDEYLKSARKLACEAEGENAALCEIELVTALPGKPGTDRSLWKAKMVKKEQGWVVLRWMKA
jgi:hypothetical protein